MAGNIDKKRNELIGELESAPAMHVGARAEILSSIALSREFAATFLRAICEQFGSYSVAGICEALARQRAICYGASTLAFKSFSFPPVSGAGTVNGALGLTEPNTSFMGIKATDIGETYTINLSTSSGTQTQGSNTFSVYVNDYYLVRSRVSGELVDISDNVSPYSTPDLDTVFGNVISWGSSVASEEEAETWNYNWAKANIASVATQSAGAYNELTVLTLSDHLTQGSNTDYTPLGPGFGNKFYLKKHADHVNTFTILGTTTVGTVEITGVSETDIAKVKYGDVISGTGIPADTITIAAVQTADSKLRLSETGIATANGTVTLTVDSVPFGYAADDIFCQVEVVAEGLVTNDDWRPVGDGAGNYNGAEDASDDTLIASVAEFVGLLGFFNPGDAGDNDLLKGASASYTSNGKEYGTSYPGYEDNPFKPSNGGTNKAYETEGSPPVITGTQAGGLTDKDIWSGRYIRFDFERAGGDPVAPLPEYRYYTDSAEKFYYELPANGVFTCGTFTNQTPEQTVMPNFNEPPIELQGKTALRDAITRVRSASTSIAANNTPIVPKDDAITYRSGGTGFGLSPGSTSSDIGNFYLMEANNIITTNKVVETQTTANSTSYSVSYANQLVGVTQCVYNYVQRHLFEAASANSDVTAVTSALTGLQGIDSFRDPIITGAHGTDGDGTGGISDSDFDANCATHATNGPNGTLTVMKAMQLSFETAFGNSNRVDHPTNLSSGTLATGDDVDFTSFTHSGATVNAWAQWVSFSNAWGTLSGALTARIVEIDNRIGTPTRVDGEATTGTPPTGRVSAIPSSNTTNGLVPYGRSLYNGVNHLLGQDVDLLGGIIKDIESLTDLIGLVETARNKYEIFSGRDKKYT